MPEGAAEGEGSEEELKRKFRAALERKRAGQAGGNAARGGQDGGKVHGAHGPAGSKRPFRRRTGG
jgi:hypothetical protein